MSHIIYEPVKQRQKK